jgi:hypothetical protein
MASGTGTKEEQLKLYHIIDGYGAPDKYIDAKEEKQIIEKAEELNIWQGQAEAMLNHRCRKNKWTRESGIAFDLRIILDEATKDDGVIDKKEFDHAIGFAVALRMPRKHAIHLACKMVREMDWKTTEEGGMFKKRDWLADYEQGK